MEMAGAADASRLWFNNQGTRERSFSLSPSCLCDFVVQTGFATEAQRHGDFQPQIFTGKLRFLRAHP
jgi:hypothetical protein